MPVYGESVRRLLAPLAALCTLTNIEALFPVQVPIL
jgi:hypothetical protein